MLATDAGAEVDARSNLMGGLWDSCQLSPLISNYVESMITKFASSVLEFLNVFIICSLLKIMAEQLYNLNIQVSP